MNVSGRKRMNVVESWGGRAGEGCREVQGLTVLLLESCFSRRRWQQKTGVNRSLRKTDRVFRFVLSSKDEILGSATQRQHRFHSLEKKCWQDLKLLLNPRYPGITRGHKACSLS